MTNPLSTTPVSTGSVEVAAERSEAVLRNLEKSSTAMDVALVATFAALIAVCSILPAIPLAIVPVPITLQTFAVLLSGAVLGARRGMLAVSLYLLVGIAGIPVFAMGRSGLAIFTGLSAGYALSFPLVAGAVGLLVRRTPVGASRPLRAAWVFGSCVLATALLTYPMGIAGLMLRGGLSLHAALVANAAFIPGDLVKCAVVAIVASAVHRAFPALLPRRRG